jgi:Arc/MetJ-type ribon-helix-helix transcriptional regulator
MRKDVMISLRLTPNQYITLLETLVKEKKSKSQFIRESINRSLFRINDKSCRKKEILEWIDEL